MKIGLYHAQFGVEKNIEYFKELLVTLAGYEVEVLLHENFLPLKDKLGEELKFFKEASDLKTEGIDVMLSLGGDGTLLGCALIIGDSGVPVLGINLGRLGFISSLNKDEIQQVMECLLAGDFVVEPRTLLALTGPASQYFGIHNYALNDFIIKHSRTNSMLSLKLQINDEWLTNYWSDGIIISTPTGSTAYSLSCSGPILYPTLNCFTLTPISPHNLSLRPIVIPDDSVITIELNNDRESLVALSLDSRSVEMELKENLTIRKNSFVLNLLKPSFTNFLNTLRHKLMWGADYRN